MSSSPRRPIADLVREVRSGSLAKEEALSAVDPRLVSRSAFSVEAGADVEGMLRGVPAGHGVASGHAVFKSADGIALAQCDVPFILVAYETFPEDIEAMKLSSGVVTVSGGITGHAGVVSRGLGKPCIGSGSGLDLRGESLEAQAPHLTWGYGDRLSFDGNTGVIVDGAARLALLDEALDEVLAWADSVSGVSFIAAVSTDVDARNAKRFGASSIALAGTDALFLGRTRRDVVEHARGGDVGAVEALSVLLERELRSIAGSFGGPIDHVRPLRLPANENPHFSSAFTNVCKALALPFARELAPAIPPDTLAHARLSAALRAIDGVER